MFSDNFNIYKRLKCIIKRRTVFPFLKFQGVRQGYNLSPVVFALFFNDLETFLCIISCGGVIFEFQYYDITLYLKLLVIYMQTIQLFLNG